MIDVNQTKEKIISFLEKNGPALPMKISKNIELSSMFASAILAELLNEKRIKTSNMLIGSSPLYMLPGQEPQLENFLNEITGIKKEALLKLKDKKVLKDTDEDPAFRAALRSIKDFSVPLKMGEEIYWKYYTIPNEEANQIINKNPANQEKNQEEKIKSEETKEDQNKTKPKPEENNQEEKQKEENQTQTKSEKEKSTKPKQIENIFSKPTQQPKKQETSDFLEKVKQFLKDKNIELIYIEETKKREITAKIRITHQNETQDYLLTAYDKKRITEKDIFEAYKKAKKSSLPYYILAKGDIAKKTRETMNAYKSLLDIDILE